MSLSLHKQWLIGRIIICNENKIIIIIELVKGSGECRKVGSEEVNELVISRELKLGSKDGRELVLGSHEDEYKYLDLEKVRK